ncbi:MAG TPA: glycosyltransferase [Patescibacteria group bacterium]|nr:glycosyltransferase [Patescibacteria group bacterium]
MAENKPKILYIITQGELGGAQKYVLDLCHTLKDTWEITIASGEPQGEQMLRAAAKDSHLPHLGLKHLRRSISPWHDLLALRELNQVLEKIRPDIIHLNSSKASILGSWAAARYQRRFPCRVVYTVHGWVFNEPGSTLKKNIFRWAEKWAAKRKDKIITLSQKERLQGQHLIDGPDKLQFIPLGIDSQNFSDKQKIHAQLSVLCPLVDTETILGTIANFYQPKGLDILLAAVADIQNELRDKKTKLLIIGDGHQRYKLEKIIRQNNLSDLVHLLGRLPDARQYLPGFDLFILPSRKEGLPYTLLEALSARIPILATDVGGISEYVAEGKNGWLCPPNNITCLQNKILAFLENKKNGFSPVPVPISSMQKMVEATQKLYLSLLDH